MKDPYKILNLEQNATDDDIRKSYRKLAKEHHPDKTGGDDTKFKEISSAYELLKDSAKRNEWKQRVSNSRFTSNAFDDQFFDEFLKNQDFSNMFNNRYGWAQNGKGQDIKSQIQITLDEAYFGTKREIRLGVKSIAVTILPGITNGQKLRLKGLGQRGLTDDLNGDLILTVLILDHSEYMIDNRGLHKIHKVDSFDAILGGKSSIDIFDKKINFTIPEGTNNGTILRINGKGFPIYNQNEKYGDLYINVIIELPKKLTEEELSLIRKVKTLIDGRKQKT